MRNSQCYDYDRGQHRSLLKQLLLAMVLLSLSSATARSDTTLVVEGRSLPGKVSMRLVETTLLLGVTFADQNGNQALDADEIATLSVTLENVGPGRAYGVQLGGVLKGTPAHVTGSLTRNYDVLEPGMTETTRMTITADEFVEDGSVTVRLDAEDRYGRSAQPKEVVIETRKLIEPVLRLVDYGIDDDDQGRSFGNNNGRIEKKESIEVKAIIQNQGQGEAGNVTVAITPPQGLYYTGKTTFGLGDLGPGEFEDIDFSFTVPPTYGGSDVLSFDVSIREDRNRFGNRDTLSLELNQTRKSAGSIEASRLIVTSQPQAEVAISNAPMVQIDVDVDIPESGRVNPDAVAVIIGNADYDNPDVPDVAYAEHDARIVKEYLTRTMGFKEGNIIIETNAGLTKFNRIFGTKDEPRGQLHSFVKPERSDVFVYYSGHGAPDVSSRQGYLVPVDCSPGDVAKNGYSLDLLYNNLSQVKARSTVVVLDACFSGGSNEGMLLKGQSPVGIRVDQPAQRLSHAAIFTSSSENEVSSWYYEKKHGLFTYFFLKGLQGSADLDKDGSITANELHQFISDNADGVPYFARRLYNGRLQTPQFYGDESAVIR